MGVIDIHHLMDTAMLFDRPEFDMADYLKQAPVPADYDLREKIEDWRENGVVIFENAVAPAEIDRFLDDIAFLCREPKAFDLEIEFRGARHRLCEIDFNPLSDTGVKFNCLENISLAARNLSLNKFACDFLGHVFQEPPVVLQSLTFWRGSNQPAHTDYPYVRTQTKLSHLAASWTSLEDVHADAGPLAYYPGSHRPGAVTPFDWGGGSVVLEPDSQRNAKELAPYLHEQLAAADLKPKIFLPKKGDVLVWHGWLVHEGTKTRNLGLTRKSYVTHFTSMSAYPRAHLFPNALKDGKYTRRHGGYVFDHPWVKDERCLPSWR